MPLEWTDRKTGRFSSRNLRKADEFSCDAIVMGTHGKGLIRHAFFRKHGQKGFTPNQKTGIYHSIAEGGIRYHLS